MSWPATDLPFCASQASAPAWKFLPCRAKGPENGPMMPTLMVSADAALSVSAAATASAPAGSSLPNNPLLIYVSSQCCWRSRKRFARIDALAVRAGCRHGAGPLVITNAIFRPAARLSIGQADIVLGDGGGSRARVNQIIELRLLD